MNEVTEINTVLPQGADKFEFIQLFIGAGESQPFNLTDYRARCDLRTHYNSGKPLVTLNTENGGILLGAEVVNENIVAGSLLNGGIALIYPHTLSSSIKFTGDSITLLRQVELIDKYNEVQRIVNGTITFTRESTKTL